MIEQAIKTVLAHQDLAKEQAALTMNDILSGDATPAQVGGLLTALRMKGETVEEIIGFAQAMREKSVRISPSVTPLIDTCGTGGDARGTFNISTAAALVVSAAGIAVAKHGNRSMSSKCGSADVLEALGVRIDITPDVVQRCIDEVGIGFMFAQKHHQAMKYAAAPRRELGVRTVFNVLGPLTNPASASYQLLGVFDADLTQPLANVLRGLGTKRAMVVHGTDGLDEITTTSETKVSELIDSEVKNYTITPEQFGLRRAKPESLLGGDSDENAQIVRDILSGKKGEKSDIVALNAGAAIYVCGGAESIALGVEQAQQILAQGLAAKKLEELVRMTNANA